MKQYSLMYKTTSNQQFQSYTAIVDLRGSTKKLGSPCVADVYLIDKITMQIVRKVTSDTDGNYMFKGLSKANEYVVMAIDKNRQYNAVIQDGVIPT